MLYLFGAAFFGSLAMYANIQGLSVSFILCGVVFVLYVVIGMRELYEETY